MWKSQGGSRGTVASRAGMMRYPVKRKHRQHPLPARYFVHRSHSFTCELGNQKPLPSHSLAWSKIKQTHTPFLSCALPILICVPCTECYTIQQAVVPVSELGRKKEQYMNIPVWLLLQKLRHTDSAFSHGWFCGLSGTTHTLWGRCVPYLTDSDFGRAQRRMNGELDLFVDISQLTKDYTVGYKNSLSY